MLNWGLIKSPANWLTVLMMLFIVGIASHFVLQHYSESKGTQS